MAFILLAEDRTDFRSMIKNMLENYNHTVIAVENGHDALEALEKQFFDFVITDFEMPLANGIQVALVAKRKGIENVIINTMSPQKIQPLKGVNIVKKMDEDDLYNNVILLLKALRKKFNLKFLQSLQRPWVSIYSPMAFVV